eukprot:46626-Eustigmatos_ZCMA.PRE.1
MEFKFPYRACLLSNQGSVVALRVMHVKCESRSHTQCFMEPCWSHLSANQIGGSRLVHFMPHHFLMTAVIV